MSNLTNPPTDSRSIPQNDSDEYSALFAQLVVQQSNMALMLLGKVPHPESGQVTKDLEAAKLFIDQLEMLQKKTKGNLTKEEETLLKQSLMSLQLSFVEAVESPSPSTASAAAASPKASDAARPQENQPQPSSPAEQEHRTKFSKKY